MLHSMRHILDDDEKWRSILRGLNKEFRHQTVTTQQVEDFINQKTGIDFGKYFDQYLRTTRLPKLEYEIEGTRLTFSYSNVVDGFDYPLDVLIKR